MLFDVSHQQVGEGIKQKLFLVGMEPEGSSIDTCLDEGTTGCHGPGDKGRVEHAEGVRECCDVVAKDVVVGGSSWSCFISMSVSRR